MISRYSVKKPYTVIVAVVLVLILGVVSFGKMNTDLLPSMNLPYAIVMTTYQGASPETVETVVTRPVEQSMATVTDIENVSSQSRENMSMVILEFAESTNMDSAAIEIREKLDQISGYWDDSVGKPMVMKLNPDMMPIMVAAVEIDNMEATEVTDYVKNNIQAEFESVAGVARVSTTGNITESVDILITEDKVAKANEKVMAALDKEFVEKESDLKDAQKDLKEGKEKLSEGKEELEKGRKELSEGKDKLVAGLAQGQQQMDAAQSKAEAGEAELNKQLAELEEKEKQLTEGLTKITEGRTQAEQGLTQISQGQEGIEKMQSALAALDAQKADLSQKLAVLQEATGTIDQQIAALDANPDMEGYEAARAALVEQKNQLSQQEEAISQGLAEFDNSRAALQEQLNQTVAAFGQESPEGALEYLSEQASTIWNTLDELSKQESQLTEAQAQLAAGKEQINQYKKQMAAGKAQISAGKIQLNSRQLLASIDMSVAQAKMDSGDAALTQNEAKLDEAEKQLKDGRKQLKEAKKQAKANASLKKIITTDMIKGILAGENFSMPAGYLTEGREDYLVRVGDKFENTGHLEELVILDLGLEDIEPIRLKDVADVTRMDDSDRVYARLNGKPGVMLSVEKQTGYSTGDVTDRLLARMDDIESEHSDVRFSVLMDQGVYIDLVVNSVVQNMLSGAVLAILILLVFLKDIRSTFIIACSIPISVVTAFVLMYFTGITLNVISLSGLALGIGMLVDNSIVVIENIDRLRQEGMSVREASVKGANQVAGAIAASTLTTVCVFAPIVFTEGITRQLFVDMGLTIAFSLLASLVVALTLVPMMSSMIMKKRKIKKFKILDKIRDAYAVTLGWALRFKFVVLILAVVLLVVSAMASVKKGTAFMPPMESTQASMTITAPKGSTFEETTACADQVIESIQDIEDIESIGAMSGGSGISGMMGGGNSDANAVSVYLLLKQEKTLTGEELAAEIENRTKDFDCEVSVSTQSMDMSALGGSGIQVEIKGKDLDCLAAIAKDVASIVEDTEGTQEVSDGLEDSDKEYRIAVNKEKAMEYKLTVAQVFQQIQKRLREASSATTLSTIDKDLSVYVRDEKDEKMTRKDLRSMKLEYTAGDGSTKKVKLSKIAEFVEAQGPQSIRRDAQSRYMTVSAGIAPGHNIGIVSEEISKKLEEYELPKGYTIAMKGEDETINDAMGQLMLMLILAVVFMYLIMVAQFQSLLSPFIVMFTIPLAFTGGFMGLVIADKEVSVIAMIGFIMLSGIIVNNGIVLVDYTNQLREEGMAKRKALILAGRDRLRPVIMTALTTILGLSSMAAGGGMGGDMVQPMAIVTIGGLIYGTILTLFVVPCIYDMLNRKKYRHIKLEDESDGNRE